MIYIYINIFIFQTKKNAKWRLSATSTWNRFWCRVVFLVQRSLRLQSRWKVLPLPPGGEATFDGWGKLGRCFPFQIWATTGTASTERFELRSSMRQKTFLRRLFRGWLVFVWLHVVEYLDRRTGRFDRERPVSFHCWQVTAQKCRICWAASGKCFSPRFLWNVLRILDHSVVVSWKTLWADLSFCRSFAATRDWQVSDAPKRERLSKLEQAHGETCEAKIWRHWRLLRISAGVIPEKDARLT